MYLHDTPSSSLFSRSRRDFSHGCVRVANPEGLAEFALKNQWSKETIQKALHTPKNQRVILKKSIPVLFFYTTAFFDHEDKLVFYPDIYGHDTVLLEALKNTEDLSDQAIFAAPPPPPVTVPKPSEGVAVETETKTVEPTAKLIKAGDQMEITAQGDATKNVDGSKRQDGGSNKTGRSRQAFRCNESGCNNKTIARREGMPALRRGHPGKAATTRS